jgi:3-methyladenine DNA glycosylase Tag
VTPWNREKLAAGYKNADFLYQMQVSSRFASFIFNFRKHFTTRVSRASRWGGEQIDRAAHARIIPIRMIDAG